MSTLTRELTCRGCQRQFRYERHARPASDGHGGARSMAGRMPKVCEDCRTAKRSRWLPNTGLAGESGQSHEVPTAVALTAEKFATFDRFDLRRLCVEIVSALPHSVLQAALRDVGFDGTWVEFKALFERFHLVEQLSEGSAAETQVFARLVKQFGGKMPENDVLVSASLIRQFRRVVARRST